jgi:hypothetical protein
MELRPGREREEVQPGGGDVFAQLPGRHRVSLGSQLDEHLARDQVHLPEVGCGGILTHQMKVLHGRARVCVAFHADAFEQPDLTNGRFTEPVLAVAVD